MNKTERPYSKICNEINKYLKSNGVSYADAAKAMNVTASAISIQLSGNKPFGRVAAEKWNAAFGFNPIFLMFGKGNLFNNNANSFSPSSDKETTNNNWKSTMLDHPEQKPLIRNIINILQAGGNHYANEAFDCLLKGDPQEKIDELIAKAAKKKEITRIRENLLNNHTLINEKIDGEDNS